MSEATAIFGRCFSDASGGQHKPDPRRWRHSRSHARLVRIGPAVQSAGPGMSSADGCPHLIREDGRAELPDAVIVGANQAIGIVSAAVASPEPLTLIVQDVPVRASLADKGIEFAR